MTKIKICGITNLNDALAAIDAGADLLGFNFYPKSPRCIDVGLCRGITSKLRNRSAHVIFVGVFVNMPVAEVHAVMETCGLELAQLHGDETPEMLDALQGHAFKAIRLSASLQEQTTPQPSDSLKFVYQFFQSAPASASTSAAQSVDPFIRSAPASARYPALLVDAAVKGFYGGSGVVANWSAAAELSKQVPLLLAGGLTPENIGAAVRQVHPWGVDVASGVEASPGKKDAGKMKQFVKEVQKSVESRK